jgi:hypothetical protein
MKENKRKKTIELYIEIPSTEEEQKKRVQVLTSKQTRIILGIKPDKLLKRRIRGMYKEGKDYFNFYGEYFYRKDLTTR